MLNHVVRFSRFVLIYKKEYFQHTYLIGTQVGFDANRSSGYIHSWKWGNEKGVVRTRTDRTTGTFIVATGIFSRDAATPEIVSQESASGKIVRSDYCVKTERAFMTHS